MLNFQVSNPATVKAIGFVVVAALTAASLLTTGPVQVFLAAAAASLAGVFGVQVTQK